MKITTKQLAQTGLLLALCIASQFFKNLSVYITGPIVNTIIIIAVLAVGLLSGLIISVIAPITAYLITASPIITAIPAVMPMIMIGNCILAIFVWLFDKKIKFKFSIPAGMIAVASSVDILLEFLITAGEIFCQQCELVQLSFSLDKIDLNTLRSETGRRGKINE